MTKKSNYVLLVEVEQRLEAGPADDAAPESRRLVEEGKIARDAGPVAEGRLVDADGEVAGGSLYSRQREV